MAELLGIKEGMTQLFDEQGEVVPCTVIRVAPHIVLRCKTQERDGYEAIEVATLPLSAKEKKQISKPQLGHFKKFSVEPMRRLFEFLPEGGQIFTTGQELTVDLFKETPYVDVTGTSIGKGFQGVMKRHNFSGGRASHGASLCHRIPGSTGMRSSPGRVFKGKKMPGRMGGDRVTLENLKVIGVDADASFLIVGGAVPGARGAMVRIRKARKKQQQGKK